MICKLRTKKKIFFLLSQNFALLKHGFLYFLRHNCAFHFHLLNFRKVHNFLWHLGVVGLKVAKNIKILIISGSMAVAAAPKENDLRNYMKQTKSSELFGSAYL